MPFAQHVVSTRQLFWGSAFLCSACEGFRFQVTSKYLLHFTSAFQMISKLIIFRSGSWLCVMCNTLYLLHNIQRVSFQAITAHEVPNFICAQVASCNPVILHRVYYSFFAVYVYIELFKYQVYCLLYLVFTCTCTYMYYLKLKV